MPDLSDPLDSRRQTGAGVLLDAPGAAMEVLVPEADRDRAASVWRAHAERLTQALGWDSVLVARPVPRGISLALSSPVDLLYTATEVNEAAWEATRAEMSGAAPPDPEAVVARLRAEAEGEADPPLKALIAAAEDRDVPLVWDDDAVTVGLGARGATYPPDALPAPEAVDWDAVAAIPTALITGTNGKTTTVRLLAAMADAAGHTTGLSTTDYVSVGGEVVERGDFSGPLGARAVMRDGRVTFAALETARGGLLRRGVPVPLVGAAAVTNVAADHLGDYGVETVRALARAKFVVAKALGLGGVLVVPADEPDATAEAALQAEALQARGVRLAWTALDPEAETPTGAPLAATVVEGQIVHRDGDGWRAICRVEDIPASLGGAARHIVRNALTASLVASALGIGNEAIATALRGFRSDADDNPGRANRFDVRGATVVVDYAHNAHGLRALTEAAEAWPAKRRLVLYGSAGDRRDEDLAAMCDVLARLGADRYLLVDIPGYLRGRGEGEIPVQLRGLLAEQGVAPDACTLLPDPLAGTEAAVEWVEPGDLAILIILTQRAEVLERLRAEADTAASQRA
ncbi:MAG: Mur ligase family protein [Bacteroidota bacterium]